MCSYAAMSIKVTWCDWYANSDWSKVMWSQINALVCIHCTSILTLKLGSGSRTMQVRTRTPSVSFAIVLGVSGPGFCSLAEQNKKLVPMRSVNSTRTMSENASHSVWKYWILSSGTSVVVFSPGSTMAGARGSKVKVQQGHHICVGPISVCWYSTDIYYTESESRMYTCELHWMGGLCKSINQIEACSPVKIIEPYWKLNTWSHAYNEGRCQLQTCTH